jgi:hypothetical protein
MAKKEPVLKPKTIANESELREMLKIFMPESDSQARKTLMDGFEILRARVEAEKSLEEINKEEFGGYIPAPLSMKTPIVSLEHFIQRSMGGERDGLQIKWVLNGVTWVFDPWTGNLNAQGNS